GGGWAVCGRGGRAGTRAGGGGGSRSGRAGGAGGTGPAAGLGGGTPGRAGRAATAAARVFPPVARDGGGGAGVGGSRRLDGGCRAGGSAIPVGAGDALHRHLCALHLADLRRARSPVAAAASVRGESIGGPRGLAGLGRRRGGA